MIKVSIAGGTGYTAGELLRILLNHPGVTIESVISSSSAGVPGLLDTPRSVWRDRHAFSGKVGRPDLIFLCLGHGLSRTFLAENNIPATCR